mmetsp:Transcript_22056/g.62717  ORF Transcript_22056/g.62717 Transcript_22056/m.62717 type:complete len:304 (-) Transcript_22056:72-983(-)
MRWHLLWHHLLRHHLLRRHLLRHPAAHATHRAHAAHLLAQGHPAHRHSALHAHALHAHGHALHASAHRHLLVVRLLHLRRHLWRHAARVGVGQHGARQLARPRRRRGGGRAGVEERVEVESARLGRRLPELWLWLLGNQVWLVGEPAGGVFKLGELQRTAELLLLVRLGGGVGGDARRGARLLLVRGHRRRHRERQVDLLLLLGGAAAAVRSRRRRRRRRSVAVALRHLGAVAMHAHARRARRVLGEAGGGLLAMRERAAKERLTPVILILFGEARPLPIAEAANLLVHALRDHTLELGGLGG